MRAFRYRLAPVLRRAEHAEHARQIELAQAQRDLDAATARLERLAAAQDQLRARLRALQQGALDVRRLSGLRAELDQLDGLALHGRAVRAELAGRLEATRERLLEAARTRRKYERHRSTLAREHRRAELARESRQLDELGTQRFAQRQHRGGGTE